MYIIIEHTSTGYIKMTENYFFFDYILHLPETFTNNYNNVPLCCKPIAVVKLQGILWDSHMCVRGCVGGGGMEHLRHRWSEKYEKGVLL